MRRLFCIGVLGLSLAIGQRADRSFDSVHAGTAIRMDLAALVDNAELVFEGRVIARLARRDPQGRIDTDFTLTVEHTFLGEPLGVRTIRMPGGVLPKEQGGAGMLIPGLPAIEVGEHLLLFLTRPSSRGLRLPVGLAQGQLRVVDQAGGRRVLANEPSGLMLIDAARGSTREAAGEAALDYVSTTAQLESLCAHKRDKVQGENAKSDRKAERR